MNHRPVLFPFGLTLTALLAIIVFIQLGILRIAFNKLGLSNEAAYLLLIASLVGSLVNIPLLTIKNNAKHSNAVPIVYRQLFHHAIPHLQGHTLIAINVGGAIVPTGFSLYLIFTQDVAPLSIFLSICIVALICYIFSRPLPGIGIGMPILIAPLNAAMIALLIDPQHAPVLAYVSGTLGVLIGADLFRLNDIRTMSTPVASIGGAGTFDGIFITGIIAVLLA